MADITDSVDLTSDLNGGGDPFGGQPYHGDAVSPNATPTNAPGITVLPEDKQEKELSLRDTLSDAFKKHDIPREDAGDRQEGERKPLSPVGEAPPADLVKVGERWHNKDGTFASQAQIDAFNAAQQAATVPEGQAPQTPLPPYQQNLTELEKQQYAALPPETRAFLDRTMERVAQNEARYSEYGQLEQLIGPRRQAWQQEGMNPYAAINGLFQLSDFAGRDPGEFVMWFADQHQLDLDALLDARDAANEANGSADPRFNTLIEKIGQLENTITGFTAQATDRDVNANLEVVKGFIAEKDEGGQPKYPYFSDVSANIGQYITNIKASQPFLSPYDTLKAAYDFACFNNPEVRGKIQANEQAVLAAKKVQEAQKARLAGSSINGGPSGAESGNSVNPSRTLREELAYQYNQSIAG